MKPIKHLKTVLKHKKYVMKYCIKAGIPIQGILHDLSKFSFVEFFESAKYYNGKVSPIDICKKTNGFSKAWFHHRGRNPHHYEYFVDNLDNGGVPIQMPYKYAVEMLCDYIGAGNAYWGDEFTYEKEWEWWVSKKSGNIKMHPHTKNFIDECLYLLYMYGEDHIFSNNKLGFIYDSLEAVERVKNENRDIH